MSINNTPWLAFALAFAAVAVVALGGAPCAGEEVPGAPRAPHLPKSRAEIMRERADKERRRRHEELLEERARQQRRLAEERKRLVAEERRQLRLQFIAKEEERLRRLQEQQKEASTQLPSWNALANTTAFDKNPNANANANPNPTPNQNQNQNQNQKPAPGRRPGTAGLDMNPAPPSATEQVGEYGQRLDCYGVPGGYAVRDECGICGGDGSTCADCAGVPNGKAREDCAGVCNGNDTSCADCAGVLNGEMTRDECGVCGGNNTSCLDCLGEVNGGAVEDACGVCAGDNSTCADCEGTPNGGVRVDPCGVCGGDGTSCCSPAPARPRHRAAKRESGSLTREGEEEEEEEREKDEKEGEEEEEEEMSRMPEGEAGRPPVLCAGHGTCSAAHRFCLCDRGWTGPFCTVRQNLCLHLEAQEMGGGSGGGFAAAACNGRGTCDPASGLCRCDDPEAWMGPRCEFSRCSRRGAYDLRAARCVCEHGYGGAHCERCASVVPREGQRHVCVEIVGAWQPVPRDLFLDRSILLGEENPRAPVFTLIDTDAATAEAYLAGRHLINIGNSATGGIRRTVIRPNSTHAASGYYYDCGCRLAAPPPPPTPKYDADSYESPEGNVEEPPAPENLVEARGEQDPAPGPATLKARAYRPFFPKRSTLDTVEAPFAMPLRASSRAPQGSGRGGVEARAPRSVAECSAVHGEILEEYGYSIEAARAESYELARSVESVSGDCDTSFGLAWSVLAILTALGVGALTWLCIWCVQRNVRFKKTAEVL